MFKNVMDHINVVHNVFLFLIKKMKVCFLFIWYNFKRA